MAAIQHGKTFWRRLLNFRIVLRYLSEWGNIVRQGASFKDKLILLSYYFRTPGLIIKSLITQKDFRQLEQTNKFLPGSVVLKNNNGVFYCGNNVFTIYTADENYEQHLYPYVDLKSGVFIDVGAHVGRYSIRLGKMHNVRVLAIEPERRNFEMLERNIALNKLTNVFAVNVGAYSASGMIPFYLNDHGEGTHSLVKPTKLQTMIPVETLDNLIEQLSLEDEVKKIKIDAEGAEVEILKGAKRVLERNRPTMVIEIWTQENLELILHLLRPYSYTMKQVDEDNYYFF
jgi:FkbM family methyltransferase